MNNDNFEWVDWIKAEREYKKWSQADLAREAKVSRATISDYELRRRVNPDVKTLSKIAVALGYVPERLLRLANIIPTRLEIDETFEQAQHIISMYRYSSTREKALSLLKVLQIEEDRAVYHAKPEGKPTPSESG